MLESLLLGSVVASTDGAATFALLRGSTLKRPLARTLEGEAGFNDPVAILLVLGFIDWIQMPGYGIGDMLVLFVRQMGIGLAAGAGVGWLAVRALRRLRLDSAGLYPVASLAVAALAFGSADVLHGSGFLAVYIAGLWLGSAPIPAKLTITAFHEGLAWVAQMALFLTLGLLVFPSRLGDVAVEGVTLALVIVLVARPVATFVATAWSGFRAGEKAVLSAAGLRGGVPVVLATFPVIHGVPGSTEFFNIVFFAVLVSTVVQGAGFEPLARWLGATSSSMRSPKTTRSPAHSCATWHCPERRSSTSSCAATRRSRRGARRACAPATGCTCSCARRPPTRSAGCWAAGRAARSALPRAPAGRSAARPCSRCGRCPAR